MAAEHPREEDLHRYFDGELRARRAGEVRAHVETCSRCSAELDGFSKLHGMMLVAADEAAGALHSDALFARISTGLHEKPAPAFGERLAMWWEALLEPWQPRGVWVPVAVTVAAGAVLFLARPANGPEAPAVARREGTSAGSPPGPAPTDQGPVAPVPTPMLHSEIIQVDFGTNAGTVFEIALGASGSTPVVWINDEEEE